MDAFPDSLQLVDTVQIIRTNQPSRRRRKPRQVVTLAQKLDIINLLNQGFTHREVINRLGVSSVTVCNVLNSKRKIIAECADFQSRHKHKRRGKYDDLVKAMNEWFITARNFHVPVSNYDFAEKARTMAEKMGFENFEPSKFWLENWKDKNGIIRNCHIGNVLLKNLGISNSVRELNSYAPNDIYTVFETGLHYKDASDRILIESRQAGNRLTVLVACNQTGSDKRPLLVMGSEPRPQNVMNLPCEYKLEPNSWMTSSIFVCWLLKLEEELCSQDRKIILLLNESPVHPFEVTNDLTNIKLLFINPANSALSKRCDVILSQELISLYKKELEQNLRLNHVRDLSVLDALHMLRKAWMGINCDTIQHSFSQNCFDQPEDKAKDGRNFPIQSSYCQGETQLVDLYGGVECFGRLSDDEICSRVKEDNIGLTFEEEDQLVDSASFITQCATLPSSEEVVQSLSLLRQYFREKEIADYGKLYSVEMQVLDRIRRMEVSGFNQENCC